jgi:1-aminocyclopropane-1-carboxylate deaminase/D-cysteine desulfhydrase-like pyridoxal-dependent ACC family enzyme
VAGLAVIAVVHDSPPAEAQGNLLLDELLGVELLYTHDPDRAVVDTKINQVADEVRRSGRRPYVIPRGGASGLGALGYVECARELSAQFQDAHLKVHAIVLATGSCGTQAGLVAGAKILNAPRQIQGIAVSRPVSECVERIARMAIEAARLTGHEIVVRPAEVAVLGGFIGAGYGIPTPEGLDAIRLVAHMEGVFLDPTYTGKAMAGLIAEIRAGRFGQDETIVFLHTGGEPGLFAHPEIAHLPRG